jgi:hypothetical protein
MGELPEYWMRLSHFDASAAVRKRKALSRGVFPERGTGFSMKNEK